MMNKLTDNLLFGLGIVFFTCVLLATMFSARYRGIQEDYKYALVAATRDATAVMLETKKEESVNAGYEGYQMESEDVPIDYTAVIKRFYDTLQYNLEMYGDQQAFNAFKQHIPLKGIVGYDSVHIALWNDNWLPPIPYSYFDPTNHRIYYYTLGENVTYYDISTGQTFTGKVSTAASPVPTYPQHEEWKEHIIMDTINQAFTEVATSDLNLDTKNQLVGMRFVMPHYDKLNSEDNIISSPGIFAYMDGIQIGLKNDKFRTFSFGGAELKEK